MQKDESPIDRIQIQFLHVVESDRFRVTWQASNVTITSNTSHLYQNPSNVKVNGSSTWKFLACNWVIDTNGFYLRVLLYVDDMEVTSRRVCWESHVRRVRELGMRGGGDSMSIRREKGWLEWRSDQFRGYLKKQHDQIYRVQEWLVWYLLEEGPYRECKRDIHFSARHQLKGIFTSTNKEVASKDVN